MEAERELMGAVKFDFNIEHPYPHVYDAIERMGKKGERLFPPSMLGRTRIRRFA